MAFTKYPITDYNNLNLDWMVDKLRENTDNIDLNAAGLTAETEAREAADADLLDKIEALDPESQAPRIQALEKDMSAVLSSRRSAIPRFFAHQGLSLRAPGNSIPAIRLTAVSGIPCAEIDVQRTADGVVVLNHDETLEAYGSSAAIADVEYSAISSLARVSGSHLSEFGTLHIPRLRDACKAARESELMLCIDIGYTFGRTEADAEKYLPDIVRELRLAGYYNVLFIGAYAFYGTILKELLPGAMYGQYQTRDFDPDALLESCRANDFEMLGLPYNYITEQLCSMAHSYGLLVYSFTYSGNTMINDAYNAGADCFAIESAAFMAPDGIFLQDDLPIAGSWNGVYCASKFEADRLGKLKGFIWGSSTSPYRFPENYNRHRGIRAIMATPMQCENGQHLSYYIDAGYQLAFQEHDHSGTFVKDSGWIGSADTGTSGAYYPDATGGAEFIVIIARKTNDGLLTEYDLDMLSEMVRFVYPHF